MDSAGEIRMNHWGWLRGIAQSGLPATVRDVLRLLLGRIDWDTGYCEVSIRELAEESGRDRGTIAAHLTLAEASGSIQMVRSRDCRAPRKITLTTDLYWRGQLSHQLPQYTAPPAGKLGATRRDLAQEAPQVATPIQNDKGHNPTATGNWFGAAFEEELRSLGMMYPARSLAKCDPCCRRLEYAIEQAVKTGIENPAGMIIHIMRAAQPLPPDYRTPSELREQRERANAMREARDAKDHRKREDDAAERQEETRRAASIRDAVLAYTPQERDRLEALALAKVSAVDLEALGSESILTGETRQARRLRNQVFPDGPPDRPILDKSRGSES